MVEWPGLSVAFHVELPVPLDDIRAHGATVTPLYPGPFHVEEMNVPTSMASDRAWTEPIRMRRLVSEWQEVEK